MSATIETDCIIIDGANANILAQYGGSLEMALFVNGEEVDHEDYERQTIASFSPATAYASGRAARARSATSAVFASSNGEITFDQIKLFAADGTTLVFAETATVPRSNTGPIPLLMKTPTRKLEFDIVDYDAACDGVTDDTAAWEKAIAAADAASGVVVHSGGVSCISSGLTLPVDSYIGIQGVPGSVLKAIGSSFGPMITREGTIGQVGDRFGYIRDLRLDGNDIATIGIRAQTVQQEFQNVTINRCTRVGFYNAGGQNNTFVSCNFEDNGTTNTSPHPDANYVLDLGARNNSHFRCQFGAASGTPANRGKYNIVFCQTAESEIADGEPPSYNRFYGCQVERVSTSHLGAVLQSAGKWNVFTDTLLQCLGLPIITITDDDGYDSGFLVVNGVNFSGNSSSRVARITSETDSSPALIVVGACSSDALTTLISCVDAASVAMQGVIFSGATTLVENYDGGSKAPAQLVVQYLLRLDGVPSGAPPEYNHFSPVLHSVTGGSPAHAEYMYQGGSWRAGALT